MRKVVLTEEMKVLIKRQLLLRKINRIEHDRLFFNPFGKLTKGKLGRTIFRVYKYLSEKSGIEFTAHNLRHTMSVQFQRRGIEQSLVSQRLCHRGGITQRYSKAHISECYQLFQEKVGLI